MSCVQLSEGGFQVVYPLWLVVPVIQSCQTPIWIWLVNHLHLQLHGAEGVLRDGETLSRPSSYHHRGCSMRMGNACVRMGNACVRMGNACVRMGNARYMGDVACVWGCTTQAEPPGNRTCAACGCGG